MYKYNLIDKYTLSKIRNYDNSDNDEILFFKFDKICNFNTNLISISNIDIIKSFILVVDFPRLGGGTNFFLNSIISKYKYKQTFLIVRTYSENKIKFTINDEYELDEDFNDETAYNFLNINSDKMSKIFINHILNHSKNFLNKIMEFKKQLITISHDHLLFTNNIQNYYNNITYENNTIVDINKFDMIITQNYENIQKRRREKSINYRNDLNTQLMNTVLKL